MVKIYVLETIQDQGKGLQYLNLKGVWARDLPHLLTELIVQLSKLKSLIIPHMADDSVLHALSGLKNLVKLDISGEACYSSNGIRYVNLVFIFFNIPNLCLKKINTKKIFLYCYLLYFWIDHTECPNFDEQTYGFKHKLNIWKPEELERRVLQAHSSLLSIFHVLSYGVG